MGVHNSWVRESICIFAREWAKIMVLPPSSRRQATVHRTVAFEMVRFPHIPKKKHPVGVLLFWSRVRESICIFAREWAKIMVLPPSSRRQATVHRTVAFEMVRFPHIPKKKHPVGVLLFWSRVRESNPPSRLGKPLYYRYTNPACGGIIADRNGKCNLFLSNGIFTCLPLVFVLY